MDQIAATVQAAPHRTREFKVVCTLAGMVATILANCATLWIILDSLDDSTFIFIVGDGGLWTDCGNRAYEHYHNLSPLGHDTTDLRTCTTCTVAAIHPNLPPTSATGHS